MRDEGRKEREAVCARRTDPHATRGRPREGAPCAQRLPEEARGRSARREEWESERERWASDEWGCRAVATNRQNQG